MAAISSFCLPGFGFIGYQCEPCIAGTFSEGGWNAACKRAPVSSFVSNEASHEYFPCALSKNEGGISCLLKQGAIATPAGYFEEDGLMYLCPNGSFSSSNGACGKCPEYVEWKDSYSVWAYLCEKPSLQRSQLRGRAVREDRMNSASNDDGNGKSTNHTVKYSFTIIGVAFGFAFLVLVLYALITHVLAKKAHDNKYRELPLHKKIVEGTPMTQEFFNEHLHTSTRLDPDGNSAIDLILARWPAYRNNITDDDWYRLIARSLPIDLDNPTAGLVDASVHNYAWPKVVQLDDEATVSAVVRVTEQAGDRADKLLYCLDAHNRQSINIASPICKDFLSRTMFLNGCYELREGPPAYQSDSTLIRFATYHALGQHGRMDGAVLESARTTPKPKVALKFMRDRWQLLKETEMRDVMAEHAHNTFLIPLAAGKVYDIDNKTKENVAFRTDAVKRGFAAYPYCVVMEAADCTLRTYLDQRRSSVTNWDDIKRIMKALLTAVHHLHEEFIVHGDIKPANIVFIGNRVHLIDLDAAVTFSEDSPQYVGGRYSSAFAPPEFIHLRFGSAVVKAYRGDQLDHESVAREGSRKYDYDYLRAHPSYDMWSLGCVLYFLCTGNALFQTTIGDNTTAPELLVLAKWNPTVKEEKLRCITDDLATNLISLLLDADPSRRIDASRALHHPFITGLQPTRLPGSKPLFDVFISYRVASDVSTATDLYHRLTEAGLTVWFDKVSLPAGKEWEDGFCEGLVTSSCFVCLLSRNGINNPEPKRPNFSRLQQSSPCDNVLLEWRLALELKARNIIDGIFPVLIGERQIDEKTEEVTYTNYFSAKCHPAPLPDHPVDAIEAKLRYHLERHGFGLPIQRNATVAKTVSSVIANQGGALQGNYDAALDFMVAEISAMHETKQLEAQVQSVSLDRTTPQVSPRSANATTTAAASVPFTSPKTLAFEIVVNNASPSDNNANHSDDELDKEVEPSPISKISARLSSIKEQTKIRRLSTMKSVQASSSQQFFSTSTPSPSKPTNGKDGDRDDPEKEELRERVQNLADMLAERDEEIDRLMQRVRNAEEMIASGQAAAGAGPHSSLNSGINGTSTAGDGVGSTKPPRLRGIVSKLLNRKSGNGNGNSSGIAAQQAEYSALDSPVRYPMNHSKAKTPLTVSTHGSIHGSIHGSTQGVRDRDKDNDSDQQQEFSNISSFYDVNLGFSNLGSGRSEESNGGV